MTRRVTRVSRVRSDRFTVLAHRAVRDENLSRRARGLLWELCSIDGWTPNHDWLLRNATDSKHKLQTAVNELKELGYLVIARHADGSTTWYVTDDPVADPIPHPDNREEAQPDNPPPDNRDDKDLRSTLEERRNEEAARASVHESNGDLFESGETDPFATEVGRMCVRLRLPWPLKTKAIDEWCREMRREPSLAGLDFAAEVRKAADYYDGAPPSRRRKRVDLTLRRWLENARKFADRDAERRDPRDDDEAADEFVKREMEHWDKLAEESAARAREEDAHR